MTCRGGGANVTTITLNSNNLVGRLPATLNQLAALQQLFVQNNQLTGAAPSAPDALSPGGSSLCPNQLASLPDPSWDVGTGVSRTAVAQATATSATRIGVFGLAALALSMLAIGFTTRARMTERNPR